MNRNQFAIAMISMVLAGFLGGMISGRIFSAQTVLAQATHEKVLKAERFELVGEDGKTSATLGPFTDDNGTRSVGLILYSQNSRAQITMAVTENGMPLLTMVDKDGFNRANLLVGRDGNPGIIFFGANNFMMRLSMANNPRLVFSDRNDIERLNLGVESTGEPYFTFKDKDMRVLAEIGQFENKTAGFALYDNDGKNRAMLGINDNIPYLSFWNKTGGRPRAIFSLMPSEEDEEPSIIFTDRSGKMKVWEAP